MTILSLWEQLTKQLEQGKNEKPTLPNDHSNNVQAKGDQKILDEISGKSPSPVMFHSSHNSHGDWGKHWAQGGYTEPEPTDNDESKPNKP